MQSALARGLTIPKQLSVIAYDDHIAASCTPALSAVSPVRDALGLDAVNLLLRRAADRNHPYRRIVVQPRLMLRETTAPDPPPATAAKTPAVTA